MVTSTGLTLWGTLKRKKEIKTWFIQLPLALIFCLIFGLHLI